MVNSKRWERKKLKYLFNIKNGGTPRSSESSYWEPEEVVWVTPEDLSNGSTYFTNSIRKISRKGLKNSSANLINSGSIVLSTRAPIGNIKISKVSYATNQGCKSLEKNDHTDIRFFYYYLSINKEYLNQLGRGTTFLELSNEALKNIEIRVPKLLEQISISDYLDKKTNEIDSLISDKERLIKLLEEKRQAEITETVTKGLDRNVKMKDSGIEWIGDIPEHWNQGKLKFLSFRIGDGLHGTPKYDDKGQYHFVNGNNLGNEKLVINDRTRNVNEKEYNKHKKHVLNGAVLISLNGTIGKTSLYSNEPILLSKSVGFINLKKDRINSNFIYNYLKCDSVATYFNMSFAGTTIDNLSLETLRNTPVLIPPEKEQMEINDYLKSKLNDFSELLFTLRKNIKIIKEYRESLIYEAVTGKIDVRDYVDETEEVN